MADTILNNEPILSLCVTVASRLSSLTIKDGQLIFIKDKQRIAFDYGGKRTFYNQIEELSSEAERQALLAPVSGLYYFILDTATLWRYQDGWVQITSKPEEIVFIGTEMPELGREQSLYVNTTDGHENISVWDVGLNGYKVVADKTQDVTEEDIEALFD